MFGSSWRYPLTHQWMAPRRARLPPSPREMTMPKKASDPGACGEKWVWADLAATRRVGAGEAKGVRGQACMWVWEARNWERRSWRKSRWRVEMSNLGHARYEASMTPREMWAPRCSAWRRRWMKSLWEPVCRGPCPGDSSGRNPFLAACSLSQCISAQEIQHLCHPLNPPVGKVASEGLLFFSICMCLQLSPSVALKNPVMNHLKHWMCIFIIKTMKPSGLAASSFLTLTLLAYALWL